MNVYRQNPYYIRVTNVDLFNALYQSVEKKGMEGAITAERQDGYYAMYTRDEVLWRDLCLYGQMLAQAQDEFIETGENRGV